MKNIILLLTLMVVNLCLAQEKRDANSLSKSEKEIYSRLVATNSEKSNRVNIFLNQNPNKKSTVFENGINYVLHDVIDNVPIYRALDNQVAARATKTDRLNPGGSLGLNLTGANMFVAVWDGGPVQGNHVEFLDDQSNPTRIFNFETTNTDGQNQEDNHANHVTGTIISKGVNPEAKGMAPDASAITYNFINDNPEMVSVQNSFMNIIISNHSYGVPVEQPGNTTLDAWRMGSYTADAQAIDDIARVYPNYLMVASAGNSGNTDYQDGLFFGFDKLTTDKVAKNNLVVANANAFFNGANELQYPINTSSSQGPTDDLRIKPDIAGDGTSLISPITNSQYGNFTGTSMAAPNVSGSLLLLQQYYEQLNGSYMRSATLKGLACHTALDDLFQPGPDPFYGWGLLDAEFAAQTILNSTNGSAIIEERTLADGDSYSFTFQASAGDNIKATICWTDVPGSPIMNGDLNNQTPRLVNDLDIRISKNGTTYLPWYLLYNPSLGFAPFKGDNSRDNVERIDIETPEAGVYTVTINHKGSLIGYPVNNQSQDYSLILTGNNLSLSTGENLLSENLFIYPNPNRGEFTIKFDSNLNNQDVKVDLYDISGRLVYANSFYNNSTEFNKTINVKDLSSGMYIVNISKGNTITTRKIIIE